MDAGRRNIAAKADYNTISKVNYKKEME